MDTVSASMESTDGEETHPQRCKEPLVLAARVPILQQLLDRLLCFFAL